MGLIFDLDHTLYPDPAEKDDLFARAAAEAAQSMGVDLPFHVLLGEAQRSGREHKSERHVFEHEYGLDREELFLRYHDFGSLLFKDSIERNKGLARCFNRIVSAGEPVAVLTHASTLWSERLLGKIGLLDTIGRDNIFAQDHPDIRFHEKDKSEKPFNVVAAHLGRKPQDCTMFDDVAKNHVIPARLGMKTVRVHWDNKPDTKPAHIHHDTDTAENYLRTHVLPRLKR